MVEGNREGEVGSREFPTVVVMVDGGLVERIGAL
jgi:hypothetical protein